MSWLVSLVLAGLMITPESNLVFNTKYNPVESATTPQVVNLDETERFEQTYPFSATGKISVSNVNGSITVEAWDRNEIRLEAVKIADSKERLTEVEIRIDARRDTFTVETEYEWKRGDRGWTNKNYGRLEVQYRLQVPRGAVLDEIETVNGSVSIANATNTVRASSVNGNVKATNLRGTAKISTVNGTTEADFDSLEGAKQITLDTVNGRVNLVIPSDANATVKADTVNGGIVNDFGLPVRTGEYVGRDLYGRIGSGAVQIKLNSVNGQLAIRRKADGKNPNPAVNLLPQKSADNDNDDDQSRVNAPKMNREIAKSIKESQKETAKAMKESEKEIRKIQPEIEAAIRESARIDAAKIVTSEQVQQQLREAQRIQREALARFAEVDWVGNAPKVEKKTETLSVKGTPKVTVDAKECSVSVKGWDRPEVQYFLRRISRNRSVRPLDLKVDKTDSTVNIKVIGLDEEESFTSDANQVRLEVFVPKKSNLRILTNREIRLENVSGEIDLTGEDEAINVRDVDGKLNLKAVDAMVRIIGFKGEFASDTSDANIMLEGDFDKITAKSVDGTIVLTLPEGSSASFVSNTEIETSGLSLTADGANRWRLGKGGAKYNFNFADGKVFVRNASNLTAAF
jgi:DUF4097 and DUF4098 domain-containing protein YvlB